MAIVLKYRGRVVDHSDVAFIQILIQEHPTASRRKLSKKLCEAWSWVQTNGTPCDMVCRGLMLALDRGGHIQLPPVKSTPHNPLVVRRRHGLSDFDPPLSRESEGSGTAGIPTGASDVGRGVVQWSDRASSLSGLHPTGRRT